MRFYPYHDHGAGPLITPVRTVLVAVTDHVGGETEPVTTAVVPGLGLSHVKTQAPVGLAWGHRPGHSTEENFPFFIKRLMFNVEERKYFSD